jgi:hypothetical protein
VKKPVIHILLLLLIGTISYANSFKVPFQFDDENYVTENPIVKNPQYLFSTPDPAPKMNKDVAATKQTRLMGYLSFALNYRIHGLRVTGYHVANLTVHLLNALLAYWLILLTFRTHFMEKSSLMRHSKNIALVAALMFVSHPLQTQSVTYISQRFTSLATMFCLLSLTCYVLSRLAKTRTRSYSFYLSALIFTVLAMQTKEIAFTLPIIIALYEFSFLKGKPKQRAALLLPLLFTLAIIPLSIMNTGVPIEESIGRATKTQIVISRHDYLCTQFRIVITYLRLLFLPINQNLDYGYPILDSFFNPQVFGSLLILLLIILAAILFYHHSSTGDPAYRIVSFGAFWFFIALSVESSVIALADVIFEHRMYLPSIGLLISLSVFVFLLLKDSSRAISRMVIKVSFVIILIALSSATYMRNSIWLSELSLWQDVVKKSPRKARAYNNLGSIYFSKGLTDETILQYKIAISLNPRYVQARYNLGLTYLKAGFVELAIEQFKEALMINPNHDKSRKWLRVITSNRRVGHPPKPH